MITGFRHLYSSPLFEGENEGGGGSGGGDDVQKRIDEAVEQAVSGLKANNAELKAEKIELKKRHDALAGQFEKLGGDEGIEALVQLRTNLEKDEVGKLLAEGKHEEWFEKRSAAMRADYENKLEAAQNAITERDEKLKSSSSQLHSTLLDVGMGKACDLAEIKDAAAREHARMLAEREFVFNEDHGQHVITDGDGGVVFGKDGKSPKTMTEWLEEKKGAEQYRLWWGESRGAGLQNGNLPSNPDRRMEALGNTQSLDEYAKARGVER